MNLLTQLPPPPNDKIGFPFTEGSETPSQYFSENLPKITIITPSFNQAAFIEETIRSVLLQNYPKLEYIIIDGGSTDGSVDIIKKYEKWLTYWVSEPDTGQSDAINKGLKLATGAVFNWLNSDDVYLPNALWKVGGYFANNLTINVLCGTEYIQLTDGSRVKTDGTTILSTLELTIAKMHNNQPPTFFRLSALDAIGRFVEPKLHYMMDAELLMRYWLRFGLKGVLKVDDSFDVFRLHADSKSMTQFARFQTDRFNLILSLLESLPNLSSNTEGGIFLLKKTNLPIYFNQKYVFHAPIDLEKLETALLERYFNWLIQYINWANFIKLYVLIFLEKPLMRTHQFYLLPLVKLKRKLVG